MMLDVLDAATADSTEAKRAKVRAAIENLEAVLGALHAAEYGKWAGFYRNDLMVSVRHTLALARGYDLKLQGRPPLPVDPYVVIKAYPGSRRMPL